MNETSIETGSVAPGITQQEIDQRVFDLYDEYCHGRIDRREFFSRAAALAIVSGSGLTMVPCVATWCSRRGKGRSRRWW